MQQFFSRIEWIAILRGRVSKDYVLLAERRFWKFAKGQELRRVFFAKIKRYSGKHQGRQIRTGQKRVKISYR